MAKRNRHNRVNATGRNATSRFARLDYRLLTSNAYRSLSPNARSLLVELTMLHNGDNNGSLYLGVRDAAHRLGVADLTAASRAFDDLKALGFVQMTQDAHFSIKAADTSRARCWRLTWLPGPGRKIASWDFLEREPEPKTTARKRMERGLRALKAYRQSRSSGRFPILDCGTTPQISSENAARPVAKSGTLNSGNRGNLPIWPIRESATHLATPWVGELDCLPVGRWNPDWLSLIAQLVYSRTLAGLASAACSPSRSFAS